MDNLDEIRRICVKYDCSPHQAPDYMRLEANEATGRKLCDHCAGTGNEFLSMYHACPKCNGTGLAKS